MTPLALRCANLAPAILAVLSAFVPMAQAAVNFEKEVLPFLQKKCIDCHRATYEENGVKKEPKADLRMDAAWAIMKGSENGPVLKPGDSAKSHMYEVVTLPEDDDDFMPSKGDPLTAEEKKLLKQWIDEGADFGSWEGNLTGKPEDAFSGAKNVVKVREHEEIYKKLSAEVKPLAEPVIKQATEAGAQIFQLKADSGLVRVDFLTGVSRCTDDKVAALLPLKENIAQLDLGRTAITDEALKTVAQLPRLVSLDLRQTKVTDAGIESLSKLKNLRILNLYGTEVGDAGIKSLAPVKSLRSVSAWQSKVTDAGAAQLKKANPQAEVTLK